MKMDTVTLSGKCNLGNHSWVGAVIDDKLFECCPTMKGPFKDLSKCGYIVDSSQMQLHKIYLLFFFPYYLPFLFKFLT